RQTDAGRVAHRVTHVADQLANRVVDLGDLRRLLSQHGVAEQANGKNRHLSVHPHPTTRPALRFGRDAQCCYQSLASTSTSRRCLLADTSRRSGATTASSSSTFNRTSMPAVLPPVGTGPRATVPGRAPSAAIRSASGAAGELTRTSRRNGGEPVSRRAASSRAAK